MTNRVFDCQRPLIVPRPLGVLRSEQPPRVQGFKTATLVALLLVPLAGAAEQPQGWTTGTLAALTVLLLAPMLGGDAPWGWFALLNAAVALLMPREQFPALGPALFVATTLCAVLWLANRGTGGGPRDRRPQPGSAEREAQLAMGLSGERQVRLVLAHDLPDEYALINGLKLPRGAGDIDHLVVGPSGVFVLETKTMAGRVVCEADGTWTRTRLGRRGMSYPAYIGNPAAQVQRNIFAVREAIRREVPSLYAGAPLWIEGLVVFPHPRTELDAVNSRVPAVKLEEVVTRICTHAPRRALQPREIDGIVAVLLSAGQSRAPRVIAQAQSAQALVEAALALPIVVALLFGTLALSRVVQAQTAVTAVAHETARAGALAMTADDAVERMRTRASLVAAGLGLDPHAVTLDWDVAAFSQDRGRVVAAIGYAVDLRDLPLLGWTLSPTVRAEHVEWVDPFRSGMAPSDGDRQ
ncbi:MAG TPA: NERD domain-containing protein [Chloroflexota bacterium]|nr:NERD domain-containing protein [Chloroflexota bacterium]